MTITPLIIPTLSSILIITLGGKFGGLKGKQIPFRASGIIESIVAEARQLSSSSNPGIWNYNWTQSYLVGKGLT